MTKAVRIVIRASNKMKLLDFINHSRHSMFVSFSKALQAFSEAALARSAIPGNAWAIEAAA